MFSGRALEGYLCFRRDQSTCTSIKWQIKYVNYTIHLANNYNSQDAQYRIGYGLKIALYQVLRSPNATLLT